MKSWKFRPIEYNVAATLAVTDNASSTVRNFPKPPAGLSIASKSPPTFPWSYPVVQNGTDGADIATAAPKHCIGICETTTVNNERTNR
jgi:hypothetical protein